jgi:hypothetical protein
MKIYMGKKIGDDVLYALNTEIQAIGILLQTYLVTIPSTIPYPKTWTKKANDLAKCTLSCDYFLKCGKLHGPGRLKSILKKKKLTKSQKGKKLVRYAL